MAAFVPAMASKLGVPVIHLPGGCRSPDEPCRPATFKQFSSAPQDSQVRPKKLVRRTEPGSRRSTFSRQEAGAGRHVRHQEKPARRPHEPVRRWPHRIDRADRIGRDPDGHKPGSFVQQLVELFEPQGAIDRVHVEKAHLASPSRAARTQGETLAS